MHDYIYPSIFFSYFSSYLLLAGAVFFCVRSCKDGYWGRDSEEVKYRMLKDDTDDRIKSRSEPMTPAKTVNEPAKEAIHEYADGWITERKGTEVPTFLKFAYIASPPAPSLISSLICTAR